MKPPSFVPSDPRKRSKSSDSVQVSCLEEVEDSIDERIRLELAQSNNLECETPFGLGQMI